MRDAALERINRLLAPGSAPLVARHHEAQAALPGPQAPPDTGAGEPPRMPFIGRIAAYQPGRSICIERELTLQEDLHLADHHFVPARPVKPLSACYPVLPLTFSLEIMAEVAACLVPGLGLTGIEQVGAARWIALADSERLLLRIEARLEAAAPATDPRLECRRLAVRLLVDGDPKPAIAATLLFGRHYSVTLPALPDEAAASAPASTITLDAAQIYASRQLFHGPSLRCLEGAVTVAGQGAHASLLVSAPDRLFHSTRQPQLLTDPALMDGVGQLIGIWAMQQRGRVTFPIGLGKLEYYAATPPPGTRAPLRIQTAVTQGKLLSTDVEIEDGAGGLWLRISGWKSWQFQWDARLLDFRRMPRRHLLSQEQTLPAALAASGLVWRRMAAQTVADFDRTLLARHYLHLDEMAAFEARAALPPRQLQWLLGRIAAKDAARAWALQAGSDAAAGMLHPAAFMIENDERGQPHVARWPLATPAPAISIAHCEGQALAAAHGGAVGVDIERIGTRDSACQAAYSTAAERQLLPAGPEALRQEWLSRLWCAKEVLAKIMGSALLPSPHHFEAIECDSGGGLLMRHRGGACQARVDSLRDGDFICALGVPGGPGKIFV